MPTHLLTYKPPRVRRGTRRTDRVFSSRNPSVEFAIERERERERESRLGSPSFLCRIDDKSEYMRANTRLVSVP